MLHLQTEMRDRQTELYNTHYHYYKIVTVTQNVLFKTRPNNSNVLRYKKLNQHQINPRVNRLS
jgi:hypothetical protein